MSFQHRTNPDDAPLIEVVLDAFIRAEPQASTPFTLDSQTPRKLQPHHQRFIAEAALIEAEPVRTFIPHLQSYEQQVRPNERIPQLMKRLDVCYAAIILLAGGRLSPDEVRTHLLSRDDLPRNNGFSRQRVIMLRDHGHVNDALDAADQLAEYRWLGYRDLARRWADEGDVASFFQHWPAYRAGTHRDGMTALKDRLVTGVVRHEGWQAGVDLTTRERRIGPNFIFTAIKAAVPETPEAVAAMLAGPAGELLTELDQLWLLLDAVLRVTPHNPEQEHPMLHTLVERIAAVDPTTDRQTMRQRDALLLRSWPAQADSETLRMTRCAARTPHIRSQLSTLPRDILATAATPAE